MAGIVQRSHNMNSGQCQLTRSLERILEEAHCSGELKLSNRKLKDFPKSGTKFNLADTVIADLSRNRFCELPEDITCFAFLETLLLYHNTIRSISQSVKGLGSLTYLDLRSNHLTALPRELCFLPLQVLLVANNRLSALPDELGRMEKLTDLDASCNQLTSLPMRIGDLRNLRSLSLRSNQLVYLPRELTYLTLISLNLSCNKITSLPVEIRQMTTLVELNLESNPLTSPPASLCVRGLVHVFKYLDTQALKDDKVKSGGSYDGLTTLRRTPRHTNSLIDNSKAKRIHVDSGYSTSDGIDKRWSQDEIRNAPAKNDTPKPKLSKLLNTSPVDLNSAHSQDNKNQPKEFIGDNLTTEQLYERRDDKYDSPLNISSSNSESTSPEDDYLPENQKQEEINKNFGNIQTYREYKEALKQQRNQEISSVYRTKGQTKSLDGGSCIEGNILYNIDNIDDHENTKLDTCNNQTNGQTKKTTVDQQSAILYRNGTLVDESCPAVTKKPVQKVIPSRSTTPLYHAPEVTPNDCTDYIGYVKPNSPIKCNGSISNNSSPLIGSKLPTTPKLSNLKAPSTKSHRNVSWNSDIPAEKLSFTMRREFDKHKEETELLSQLRTIIQTRLKMNMPDDIASALADGVVLCHLANYIRPRSVGSIHVPSPGVPKLTMARCRRNVDNFLEACRKIGVDEELICSCADVVSNEESSGEGVSNPSAVLRTIAALLNVHRKQQQSKDVLIPATNANRTEPLENCANDEHITTNECFKALVSITTSNYYTQDIANANFKDVLCSNIAKTTVNFENQIKRNMYLQNIEEECETTAAVNCERNEMYCKTNQFIDKDFKCEMFEVNDLNTPTHRRTEVMYEKESVNVNTDNNIPQKIVTKRIEFFDGNATLSTEGKLEKSIKDSCAAAESENQNSIRHDSTVLSIILSCTFIITFLLLTIFPLPN